MSVEHRTGIGWLQGKIFQADKGHSVHWTELDEWIWKVALVERLERLVEVLEQVRDRLPGQIAK